MSENRKKLSEAEN